MLCYLISDCLNDRNSMYESITTAHISNVILMTIHSKAYPHKLLG